MTAIHEIFNEYIRMRQYDLDAKEALRALRVYVEHLSRQEKDELARALRAWEASGQVMEEQPPIPQPVTPAQPERIKPLRAPSEGDPGLDKPWITCQNCGKKNRSTEVFCYSCGHMLEVSAGTFATKTFAGTTGELYSDEFFGSDSVLILRVRGTNHYFELRPQLRDHEIVIGRSTGSVAAIAPDIDVAQLQGAELGVSRLHLAVKYIEEDNVIQVYDLGSANGSYINGQRLHAREQRLLRHGDELRLSQLVLRVVYAHPGDEIADE